MFIGFLYHVEIVRNSKAFATDPVKAWKALCETRNLIVNNFRPVLPNEGLSNLDHIKMPWGPGFDDPYGIPIELSLFDYHGLMFDRTDVRDEYSLFKNYDDFWLKKWPMPPF